MGRKRREAVREKEGTGPGALAPENVPAAPAAPRWLVPAVLAVVAATSVLSGWGAFTDSITADEGQHLASGYAALKFGDFRVNPEHPPLAKVWAALPLMGRDVVWPDPSDPGWRQGQHLHMAIRWLQRLNDGQSLVVPARLAMLVFPALLVAAVFVAGWRLFGPAAGAGASLVAALDPSLLAHGHLVTTDVPVAAAVLVSLVALDWAIEKPSAGRVAAFVLAVAAAAVTKFSWLFLVPVLAIEAGMLAVAARGKAGTPAPVKGWKIAVGAVVLAAGVWSAIWAAYGFRYAPYSEPREAFLLKEDRSADGRTASSTDEAWEIVARDLVTGDVRTGLLPTAVAAARTARLAPEPYLFGLAYVDKWAQRRSSYLLGEVSRWGKGSPLYFPVAFVVKTPAPSLVAMALGAAWLLWRRPRPSRAPLARALVVFSALYVGFAVVGHLNIGYRHLFPALPLCWIAAGVGLAALWPGRGRLAAVLLAVWLAADVAWVAPRFLSFFNEPAGGRSNGWKWLADSNLDWGQDALRLETWLRGQPPGPVYIADGLFRAVPPHLEPLRLYGSLKGGLEPGPGTWIVSVNTWVGLYEPFDRKKWTEVSFVERARRVAEAASSPLTPPQARERAVREAGLLRQSRVISRLRSRPPEEVVGDAYFVYRVPESEYRELSSF